MPAMIVSRNLLSLQTFATMDARRRCPPGGTPMAENTLAKLFWSRVDKSADKPAQMFKQGAGWTTLTWREVGEAVREVALGLIALGRGKGDTVALLSQSRAEWVQADFAIFSAGCVTVPIYPS